MCSTDNLSVAQTMPENRSQNAIERSNSFDENLDHLAMN